MSDKSNDSDNINVSDKPVKKTSVGGQAIIEGLMMIGPNKAAIAVRKPNSEIELQTKPLPPKSKLSKIPVLRGVTGLFRQMVLGMKALMYSSEFVDIEEESAEGTEGAEGAEDAEGKGESSKFGQFLEEKFGNKGKDIVIYCVVVVSLCFSVGLFILLPNIIVSFFGFDKTIKTQLLLSNLCEGIVRVVIFLGYMALTSRMKEISRVWQYHGAEHKTIHCYEHEMELTVENIQRFSTKHPRCGTSFLFLVMVISILVFSFTDILTLQLPFQAVGIVRILFNLLTRIIMIPLVAGLSYEVIKIAGKYDNVVTRIISAPGLLFQRFTTREPDDSMIEVAILAFNTAMGDDEAEAQW
ncbi:MAG: DUF1385 domain-containing protein [Oscillospiraceae bacterium]|nr:DUF1385 domain-containing protein [Oscillospiraceae bacterium]